MVAPYLDMGAYTPANLYRAISKAGLRHFSAGFVIGHGCTPTWDDHVAVATDKPVNRVITKAESLGAQPVISFGGQGGKDLARSCHDPQALLSAYEAVVNRYRPAAVDFDIEGDPVLNSPATIKARFVAIRQLEALFPKLVVSLTVAVEPHGLDSQGLELMRRAKANHARIDLVNIMAMDYGGGARNMGDAAVSAAKATLVQLRKIWPGWTYSKLGITPMLGINDNQNETFTVANAKQVSGFARAHHVGRLAFWALGRDGACGQPPPSVQPQYNCSGIAQSPLAFTRAFLT
jgi:chitinase